VAQFQEWVRTLQAPLTGQKRSYLALNLNEEPPDWMFVMDILRISTIVYTI
jgi:hypothetical protein